MGHEPLKAHGSKSLSLIRWIAFCVLFIERFWRLVWPAGLVIALFLALSWFGVFARLSFWWHIIILWGLILAALVSLARLRHLQLPKTRDVDRRIEQNSGIKFQALESQHDFLPENGQTAFTQALWLEHQRRLADMLGELTIGTPHPDIPSRDPHAIRSLLVLLACVGFFFSFGKSGGSIGDALRFAPIVNFSNVRIDAWVNPPNYTHQAPIYLSQSHLPPDQKIKIPAGSNLTIRVAKNYDLSVAMIENDGKRQAINATRPSKKPNEAQQKGDNNGEKNSTAEERLSEKTEKADLQFNEYNIDLLKSAEVLLSGEGGSKKWVFDVKPDHAPTIRLTDKEPGRILNGSLELNYEIDDDYGATKAWAEISQLKPTEQHALFGAPEISLILPTNGKGKASTVKDISNHPWAGSEVRLRLVVEDGAGKRGYSKFYILVLPQHVFGNPLARAIIEQRRILAVNALKRDHVLDMLAAIMVRPQQMINDIPTYLVMQSAWTRLSLASNDDQFRDVVGYMWQIATGIEGDLLSDAEKRLHQAQAALRDALRNGASNDEIKRLTENLRQAMLDYMREFARNAQKNKVKPSKGLAKILNEKDIEALLKRLQELAETGDQVQADQVLSQLEELMKNLRIGSGAGQSGTAMGSMQQQLNKLGDLMRRQQEALDETHKSQDEMQRGEKSGEDYRNKLDGLKQKQQNLESQLKQFQNELEGQNLKPGDGLEDAERAMKEAENALGQGRAGEGSEQQKQALEGLRKAGNNLVDQMKQALNKGEDQGKTDPLGRKMKSNSDQNKDFAMPSDNDLQKSREILNEIRKRLGRDVTEPVEKQYLERLLKFNE